MQPNQTPQIILRDSSSGVPDPNVAWGVGDSNARKLGIALPRRSFRVIGLLASLMLISGCDKTASEVPTASPDLRVTVAEIKNHAIDSEIVLHGQIVAPNSVRIAPELDGLRIEGVHADVGQRVHRGQLLIDLDAVAVAAEYQQARRQAEKSSALFAQAAAQQQAARSQLALTQSELARHEKIFARGAISAAELEMRTSAAEQSASSLVAAERARDAAQAEQAYANAQVLLASSRLGKARIVAPISGTLAERHAIVGSIASSSAQPLFVLHPDGLREFEAMLDLNQLQQLQPDSKVRVRVTGSPGLFDAKLRVKADAVRSEDRSGVVRFTIADGDALQIGASAQAHTSASSGDGIWITHAAVLFDPEPSVFVLNPDRKVQRRIIRVANSIRSGHFQVLSGLEVGEFVVSEAAALLIDGTKVRPIVADNKPLTRDNRGPQDHP